MRVRCKNVKPLEPVDDWFIQRRWDAVLYCWEEIVTRHNLLPPIIYISWFSLQLNISIKSSVATSANFVATLDFHTNKRVFIFGIIYVRRVVVGVLCFRRPKLANNSFGNHAQFKSPLFGKNMISLFVMKKISYNGIDHLFLMWRYSAQLNQIQNWVHLITQKTNNHV